MEITISQILLQVFYNEVGYNFHFTDKETEAQKDVTSPGPQKRVVLETRLSGSREISALERITTTMKGRRKIWQMTEKGKRFFIVSKLVMECLPVKVT